VRCVRETKTKKREAGRERREDEKWERKSERACFGGRRNAGGGEIGRLEGKGGVGQSCGQSRHRMQSSKPALQAKPLCPRRQHPVHLDPHQERATAHNAPSHACFDTQRGDGPGMGQGSRAQEPSSAPASGRTSPVTGLQEPRSVSGLENVLLGKLPMRRDRRRTFHGTHTRALRLSATRNLIPRSSGNRPG